jgi:hypothetical protein
MRQLPQLWAKLKVTAAQLSDLIDVRLLVPEYASARPERMLPRIKMQLDGMRHHSGHASCIGVECRQRRTFLACNG